MKHRIEVWNSSENREERHYFVDGEETYLFGYNPLVIPESEIKSLLTYLENH